MKKPADNAKYNILVIAESCADIIFTGLKKVPSPGEEEYSDGLVVRVGGGANTAYMLSKLGIRTALLTNIGKDFFGKFMSGILIEAGVDLICSKNSSSTSVTAVMTVGGDRAFASYSENRFKLAGNEITSTINTLFHDPFSIKIIHSCLYCSSAFDLPRIAREHNALLSVDAGWGFFPRGEELKKLLDGVWTLKMNKAEARELSGEQVPEKMLGFFSNMCPNVIITLGMDGCMALMDGEIYTAEAPPVTVVDTTGAGDAFASGWLNGYTEGLRGQKLINRACAAGSHCVTLVGGTDPGFSRKSVLELAGEA